MDLSLALVGQDLGADVALAVARLLDALRLRLAAGGCCRRPWLQAPPPGPRPAARSPPSTGGPEPRNHPRTSWPRRAGRPVRELGTGVLARAFAEHPRRRRRRAPTEE